MDLKNYKSKLEQGICDYMEYPVNEQSADAVKTMIKCYKEVNKLEKMLNDYELPYADIECWNEHMENADGTTGGHWTTAQTTEIANDLGIDFEHITEQMFNVTMNMMYSDYFNVARKYAVNTPSFYGDLAKAFLFDKDGGKPQEKLSAYYRSVVVE